MGGLQFHLHFVTQKRLQRVEQVRRLHTARCVMCVSQTFPDILDTRFYGGRRERVDESINEEGVTHRHKESVSYRHKERVACEDC